MSVQLRLRKLIWFIPIIAITFFAGCGSPSDAPTKEDGPAVPLMGKIEGRLTVDGSTAGYPGSSISFSGVDVHLAHDGTNFYVHARAESQGWISVGFNEKGAGMDGANMVLGFVDENGGAVVRNDLGRGTNHSEVGAPGIIEAIVLQDGDFMLLEFSYPMVFPGGNNFRVESLASNQVYSLIAATNTQSGDLSRSHSNRGKMDFQVE